MKSNDEEIVIKAARYYIRQTKLNWAKYIILVILFACYLLYLNFFHVPAYAVSYIELKDPYLSDVEVRGVIEAEVAKSKVSSLAIRSLKNLDESYLQAIESQSGKSIYIVEKR